MPRVIANRTNRSLASIGWRLPLVRLIMPPHPTVLLYHSVLPTGNGSSLDAASFEQQVAFLKKNFELISPEGMGNSRRRGGRTQVLLTFDDGMRNNFEVVRPILARHHVPALFFISSRHAEPGQYLWFVYLRALTKHFPHAGFVFRHAYIDMRPSIREASMKRLTEVLLDLRPHPTAMYRAIQEELPPLQDFMSPDQLRDECEGMTAEQVGEMAADTLFSIGCHTVDHPFLSRCEPDEMCRQIDQNKRWLESATGLKCDTIAYPVGDYDAQVLGLCRRFLFSRGYAVSASLRSAPELEISRIGVYSTSLEFLGFKVLWGNLLRAARIAVG